ncbi:putative C6 transcription factor [Aspergillus clavatus NRRL 1]|uniref:C6 zinc finger domain protein n=1 Tax=Aspergillus clavatus (strain ATCC 1007 / CBS 513.65 / DSM 816 / NCTC 3887 / NRRL 1 / QM 1276 / 107) TaxID=344612 RepID=A1C4L1_ASPCL|nr:C6 zinc finger domain protein [Aspergillus clavatus NRRL 1]EAW15351.1 C6 zinc finger domain protein [Aspergillus clavatus NRRL 1]
MSDRPPHGNATVSNASVSGKMRQRSRQACGPCRQRKRKCDGQFPCSTCTGYGYDCQYMDEPSKAAKRSADDAGLLPLPPAKEARVLEWQDTHANRAPAISTPSSGILEPLKLRYMGRHSSVAFPMTVGLEMQAANPPRLHSFAYNPGVRAEPGCGVNFDLATYISWDKVKNLMDVYSLTVHPVFGILDLERLSQRGEEHWHGRDQGLGFEALISGVIGLGSLFSGFLGEDQEMRIVRHAKEILEDASIGRVPSIDKIAGWILRTVYVRTTSRPHSAWMCSCTTMHLVEAAGLHQPLDAVVLTTGDSGKKALEDIAETRERIAQIAQCLNIIIAYDYGRSVVNLGLTWKSGLRDGVRQGDWTPQLFDLVGAVPLDRHADDAARRNELMAGLDKVAQTVVEHDFLVLIKADLAFCLFRRLRVLEWTWPPGSLHTIVSVGLLALPAARRLMVQNHPWWNVVGTVFQFICVLIAIDTTESLETISEAMETLEMITERLSTHLAIEALHTARHLVRASLEKKHKGISILERVSGISDGAEGQWPSLGSFLESFQQTPSMDMDFLLGMDLLL